MDKLDAFVIWTSFSIIVLINQLINQIEYKLSRGIQQIEEILIHLAMFLPLFLFTLSRFELL